MTFTYDGYIQLIRLLKANGYKTGSYHNWAEYERCVILRHDVDTDLQKALEMAELEYRNGISSTYFVLLTSNFYNLYSYKSGKILKKIQNMGHKIGLHFDEMAYPTDSGNVNRIKWAIQGELDILEKILKTEVTEFSYHRPTQEILDADICLQGITNVYGTQFFKEFKYLSDSRMRWREPVEEIVKSGKFPFMQILLHPFWYHEKEMNIREIIKSFVLGACAERYQDLDENMTELSEIVKYEEMCRS